MKISVLDGYTLNSGDLSWSALEALGELTVYDRTPRELIEERASASEIVLTNKTPLDDAALRRLPKLRYIGVLATGFDVVDVKSAAGRGIVVTNIPAYGTDSVAQFVFALLMELCHAVGRHNDSVKCGAWSANEDWSYRLTPLVELSGKTMGIVGFGRIGMRTAAIAQAFGMDVIANARNMTGEPSLPGVRWAELNELLQSADVLSLHCPATPATLDFINRERLSRMKTSAFLINTSRGKLVNESDLAAALDAGTIAGAAVDVLSIEPPGADHPLLQARNCIITPHNAWGTKEARSRLLDTAVDNVRAFLEGKSQNIVKG
ncbi:D-2-hydroxyacid dehydrogenase [Paenibacillus abyssi]|uniref:D-2-hydroxyacid dehydrogenase n=1 Tax=Paenibacillus abyssi TaxID=1340531 RepID=UPI00166C8E46|nr:D-2-hydroxyacid dehydrogenase [Paenibacillus abyssi]